MRTLSGVLLALCAMVTVGVAAEKNPMVTLSISLTDPDPIVLAQITERVHMAGMHNQATLADPTFILRVRKDGKAEALFATMNGYDELQPLEMAEQGSRSLSFDRSSPLYSLAQQASREVNESDVLCDPPEGLTRQQLEKLADSDGCAMPQTPAVRELLQRISAIARR